MSLKELVDNAELCSHYLDDRLVTRITLWCGLTLLQVYPRPCICVPARSLLLILRLTSITPIGLLGERSGKQDAQVLKCITPPPGGGHGGDKRCGLWHRGTLQQGVPKERHPPLWCPSSSPPTDQGRQTHHAEALST